MMLKLSDNLRDLNVKIQRTSDVRYVMEEIHQVEHVAQDFADSEKHFLREENVLFPLLERHGVTEPPSVMWMDHSDLKETKKTLHSLVADLDKIGFEAYKQQLSEVSRLLGNQLQSHFYKENNVLFPTVLNVITEAEWADARLEFDEIGYCCFTPPALLASSAGTAPSAESAVKSACVGEFQFETGSLNKEQLEALLNTLSVDVTFVDAEDTVRFFNKPESRLFVRTKAIIGRKVQQCHPQKSLPVVKRIVESFKAGKKNSAEFWINFDGKFVSIRFFAVRDKADKYLGTVEVVQDLTELRQLQGEKRLLDWTE